MAATATAAAAWAPAAPEVTADAANLSAVAERWEPWDQRVRPPRPDNWSDMRMKQKLAAVRREIMFGPRSIEFMTARGGPTHTHTPHLE